MSTLHGIDSGAIYPQPGFTVTQDQNGTWTATRDYSMRTETWNQASIRNLFARGTFIYLLDTTLPDFWNFLTVTDKNIVHEEGGIITISVSFNGTPGAQFGDDGLSDEALPTYRLEGRLMELPLSEHPKWKALSEVEQVALGKLISGDYAWGPDPFTAPDSGSNATYIPGGVADAEAYFLDPDPITTSNAIQFASLISKGRTTYNVPTVSYTETSTGDSQIAAAQLNKLGKISTPRGNPPTVGAGYNWMLTGANQEQRGEIYQTSFEWTLSGASGWDDFLYD